MLPLVLWLDTSLFSSCYKSGFQPASLSTNPILLSPQPRGNSPYQASIVGLINLPFFLSLWRVCPSLGSNTSFNCETFQLAEYLIAHHPRVNIWVTFHFEFVHLHVWGPWLVESNSVFSFLWMIDFYVYTWPYLIYISFVIIPFIICLFNNFKISI